VVSSGPPARTADPAGLSRSTSGRPLTPLAVLLVVAVVGGLITVAVSWTAWTLNRRNERSLLMVQTRQAAAVLTASVLTISDPLAATLQIEEATNGDVEAFGRSMGPLVGAGRLFVSASLYRVSGSSTAVVTSLGAAPLLTPESPSGGLLLRRALTSPAFVVAGAGVDRIERVGYAIADPAAPRFVVHAERAIPANRLVPALSNPAFANLDFATYLGPTTSLATLATTDVPLSRLPLDGDTVTESIPFGDTTLTLVAAAHGHLGGPLGWQLPWILLAGGLALTAASATVAVRSTRRRGEAERDAVTITGLYATLDGLYAEQRGIAETLQRALLPRTNPEIPGLDIASRYVSGVQGVDIGGDWYSVIAVDDTHVGFVVGDVSGRGVSAATVMARLRFTMRAYLLEGHPPDAVLAMCSRQLDLAEDGHFATVLIGLADLVTREVVLANAGHLEPLVVRGGVTEYVATKVGLPLGVDPGAYLTTGVVMERGSVLLAFTDGLVERRGESLDDGLDRLAQAAADPPASLDDFIGGLVRELTGNASEDDVAVLALRWS